MELRDYQKECIETIQRQKPGSYLIQMTTGLGKCLAKGTPVLMYDGTVRPVENILEGDFVMGPDSKPRKVTGLTNGISAMYQITPEEGEPYVVNEGHILSLKIADIENQKVTSANGRKYHAGDICNISVNDYLASSELFRHAAKGWRTGVKFLHKDVTIPPYILGVCLGDGLSLPETENTNFIIGELKKYDLLQNKHIPHDYLANDRSTRLDLLAGLLDTDGCLVEENVFEMETVSETMKNNILFLARSLGFAAYDKEKYVDHKVYYRITISGNTSEIPNRVARKKASERLQKKNMLVTGITVKQIGKGEYFGFELLGTDRLFLLGDFTVTHNTVTFANIPRQGRVLLLSHREELVKQPQKYYDCSYGIEQGENHSCGEEVVSASVLSMHRRLDRFSSDEFDMIICDEAHHAAAKTYRKIFDHFQPRLLLGFTATPNRGDHVRLDDVFSEIIFQRDLKWGIENQYLCNIFCKRVHVGYDLSSVHTRGGDYVASELDMAMEGTADAIAEVYRNHAVGATLIFAVSVRQCQEIAERIPGAVTVTGDTDNRADIITAFTEGEISCIVNCMVFTEGTDIPRVETVIVARPTQSESLYQQMVGRGLRLYPGKDMLTLIDCVGVTGSKELCTAPSLLGIDMSDIPQHKRDSVQGNLLELPAKSMIAADCPDSWIRNVEIVNLWAEEQNYDLHDVNFFKTPDGKMSVSLMNGEKLVIPAADSLGNVTLKNGKTIKIQDAIDIMYQYLKKNYHDQRHLWDMNVVKKWMDQPPTEKQLSLIQKKCRGFRSDNLTKGQASMILNRLLS